jgi:predicted ribosomally synthesized peptide with SipW-like signal peptide
MSRFLRPNKKRITFGVLVALLVMVSAGAFAYWTSSGEGSGTIKSNYASAPFEVTSGVVENLYPGGSAAVAVKVKNIDLNQSEFLTKVEAEVKETSAVECKKEWFEVTPASQEPKALLAHGETKEYTVTLKMKEEAAVNQNACKGASVTLHYKVS